MLAVASASLNEAVELALVLEDFAHLLTGLSLVVANDVVGLLVPELESGENLAQVLLGLGEDLLDSLVGLCREHRHVHGFGAAGAQNGHGRDDAKRSLRTDEQLLEIEASLSAASSIRPTSVVFAQSLEAIPNCAVSHNDLQTKNGAVQRSIAKQTKTTGISSDIATDVT